MADYTITVKNDDILTWEAGLAGLDNKAWLEQYVNGHIAALTNEYATAQAAKTEQEKQAAVTYKETWTKLTDALAAMSEQEKKETTVEKLLADAAAVQAPGDEEPLEG